MQWPIENIIPVYYLVFYCSLSPFSSTHIKIALPNNILAHIQFSQALLSGEPMLIKWITNTALWRLPWYSVHFSSVTQSYLTLWDPMYCSTPGLPVHHQLQSYPNSCSLSWWCHPTISSSVVPFFSCLQSFPALGSFQMSQLFASGGQSTGVSALAPVLPMNTQDWSPLGWTGWISLQSKGLSRVFSNTTVQKHQFFGPQLSL